MFFLIDTETTDLVKPSHDFLAQPGIVQVAVLVLNDKLDEMFAWSSYVNPEIAVFAEKAVQTHGITREMVRDAPTFFQVFDQIANEAGRCHTWAGYNIKFDRDVLWYQLLRYGFERNFPWPRHELDVMRLVREHFGEQGKKGEKNIKQSDAYERLFKRPMIGAHDALADIRATAEILRELQR